MSSRSRSPEDSNSAWSPNSIVRDQDFSDGVDSIKSGTIKIFEGGQEAASGLIILLILILLSLRDRENEVDTVGERSDKWDERAKPIQDRFEEENVTEEDVEQAIEWARSE